MNFERIALLLHVAESTMKFPQLKPIHDAAVDELNQHAAGEHLAPEEEETEHE